MAKHWTREIETDSLECRDTSIRHYWDLVTVRRIKGGFERFFRCPRCTTEKFQELDLEGFVIRTRIKYPTDGYLRPKGSGRMTAKENARVRAEVMRRLTR